MNAIESSAAGHDDGADGASDNHRTGLRREPLSPLEGEAGLPSVEQRRRFAISGKGLLTLALLTLLICGAIGFTIQHFARSKPKSDEGPQRVGDRPAAASREARTLDMPAVPVVSVVTAGGAATPVGVTPTVPAIVPTAEELAEPIGVRRTGAGAPAGVSSSGAKVAPPEDAPVLLVSTRPGALSSGFTNRRPDGPPSLGMPATAMSPTSPSDGSHTGAVGDPVGSTARNMAAYQQQLQGLLEQLTKVAVQATGQAAGAMPTGMGGLGTQPFGGRPFGGTPTGAGAAEGTGSGAVAAGPVGAAAAAAGTLFGGQLQGSVTPRVVAANLAPNPEARSLTLPKGTAFTCALKTRVVSATSGFVGCQVRRNVYGDDGRVLLIERGSHLDGEYRVASVKPGTVRIPVLWTRIRTPMGVTVELDSPGTGALGESGIDGHVDNRWVERIGAALLLSLIDDSVKLVIQSQTSDGSSNGNSTVLLPSTTNGTSKLTEKVLDSTINIPPLITRSQGGIVGIYVARDVDFSTVYALQPGPLPALTAATNGVAAPTTGAPR